jgi:recombination protein RecR
MAEDAIRRAVSQLRRLPGIGEKSATRLVYWLLRAPTGTAGELAAALAGLAEGVAECSTCCNLGSTDPCPICANPGRDPAILCVVEEPQDVLAFERTGDFRGRYHVLHGAISPLDGVSPDALRIRPLLERLRDGMVREVILATNPTIEGDATALYLGRLLGPIGLRVTRLAHGLSVGTEIEYADAASLGRALANRRDL